MENSNLKTNTNLNININTNLKLTTSYSLKGSQPYIASSDWPHKFIKPGTYNEPDTSLMNIRGVPNLNNLSSENNYYFINK